MDKTTVSFTSNERFEHQLILEAYREDPHDGLSTTFKITLQSPSNDPKSISFDILYFRFVISTFCGMNDYDGIGGVYRDKDNNDLKLMMFKDFNTGQTFMTITEEEDLGKVDRNNIYYFTKEQIKEIGDKFREVASLYRI